MMAPKFPLRNGSIPALGFGTWQITGKDCTQAVREALAAGYTHIDTAIFYQNHTAIREAIKEVPRESLFITSKVPPQRLGYEEVIAGCKEALSELGTGYLDLYLVHFPNKEIAMTETFKAMAELVRQGKVKAVGVSNFTVRHLEEARKASSVPIVMNQVEFHPFLYQQALLEYCQKHDVLVTAYCPLARGKVFADATLKAIGERHGKSAGQVALRWLHQKGIVVIPKASSQEHIVENADIFDFELGQKEMDAIDALPRAPRIVDPPFGEFDD